MTGLAAGIWRFFFRRSTLFRPAPGTKHRANYIRNGGSSLLIAVIIALLICPLQSLVRLSNSGNGPTNGLSKSTAAR
jgi:hypothetical protein